jgi:hypothetical protein
VINYNIIITIIFFSINIGIALIIETTSWSVRSLSNINSNGIFIARTNIYLYGGRFFMLFFSAGLGYVVDNGSTAKNILLLISISYMSAGLLHSLLLIHKYNIFISSLVAKFLGLTIRKKYQSNNYKNNTIKINTLLSTVFFTGALMAPFMMASIFPQYRMTMVSLGQIINSIGTLILLFFVDPKLYKLMDEDKLFGSIKFYIQGRCFGFMIASILSFSIYLFL